MKCPYCKAETKTNKCPSCKAAITFESATVSDRDRAIKKSKKERK